MTENFEHQAALTGIGMSQVGRRLGRHPLSLVRDACLAAIEDAGLTVQDIDGLTTSPGALPGPPHGVTFGGTFDLAELLGIFPTWISGGLETAGHTGIVVDGALAVAGGLCRNVLCVRATWESTHAAETRAAPPPDPSAPAPRLYGWTVWQAPFGALSPANWLAMYATRHMERFGTTREQLGAIALNARANAALNETAIYRDPMTMDDYLSARLISTPFGLYDCDVPCDGAVAVVVSHIDEARDRPRPAVRIEAAGTAISERISWDQDTLDHEPLMRGAADHLWSRTNLRPADVDVAELYDGFTFNCLSWIESLGFCGIGEGGPFVEGGITIARDGTLPLNTHGGQLSAGRLHGFGFLHEAVVQLRGDGGARQVANEPEVALVATGGGLPGGALLLTTLR